MSDDDVIYYDAHCSEQAKTVFYFLEKNLKTGDFLDMIRVLGYDPQMHFPSSVLDIIQAVEISLSQPKSVSLLKVKKGAREIMGLDESISFLGDLSRYVAIENASIVWLAHP